MRLIALTGGIASGKSTVAALLAGRGAVIIDADAIAREVVEPGQPALAAIAERFGSEMIHPDGNLDRAALGKRIFADAEERRSLEAITHPTIREQIEARTAAATAAGAKLVIHDIPLLFESGRAGEYPEVLVVYLPEPLQRQRLRQRDGLDDGQISERLLAQIPIDDKRDLATWVIDNSGTTEATRALVDAWWLDHGRG